VLALVGDLILIGVLVMVGRRIGRRRTGGTGSRPDSGPKSGDWVPSDYPGDKFWDGQGWRRK
jgi:hypothetical protein